MSPEKALYEDVSRDLVLAVFDLTMASGGSGEQESLAYMVSKHRLAVCSCPMFCLCLDASSLQHCLSCVVQYLDENGEPKNRWL